jgi:crotonobetainyl-CoA:carnitine CoA-transferase CaiB-like acyl-CoA transferase
VGGEHTARDAGTPLGHHNTAILASLGYSPDEIEEFRKNGVIN